MFSVIISRDAERQILKLPTEIQLRINAVLKRIAVRPFHFVKKLEGTSFYRLRVGDYRIILDITEDKLIILVVEVGHRKNIYK